MIELDNLIDYCHSRFIQSSCDACKNNTYCTSRGCHKGNCNKCLEHILHNQNPSFHYPCNRITYYYTLKFFDRFASEIKRFFLYTKLNKRDYYFVSLGCGPGSELYGLVDGMRHCLGNNFSLKYRGYDTEPIWKEIQDVSKANFVNSNCDVDFYASDMFANWQDDPNAPIDVLVMNYLLSDSQKYMSKNGTLLPFLDNIVDFVIQHKVPILMCNDIRYYGYYVLDSGVKCMDYIISKIALFAKKVHPVKIYYLGDPCVPNGWNYSWHDSNILFNTDKTKTSVASPWDKCRSKYIFVKIDY